MKKVLKWIGIGFLGLIALGVVANMGKQTVPATPSQQATPKAVVETAKVNAEPVELSSGNYMSGKDFPEGVYDITWVKGYGNVISTNQFSGGINAIMGELQGVETKQDNEYKNIKLPKGTELRLTNVTVRLTQK